MKIFYTIIFVLISLTRVSAQCTPDTGVTHNVAGTYPDTITNLPASHVGSSYSTVLQVYVGTTFTSGGITVPADSVVITNVIGLPIGFSYACYPNSCNFPAGQSGCIALTGSAPSLPMIGSYPLTVQAIGYYKLLGTPQHTSQDLTGYTIVIDSSVTGINTVEKLLFSVGQNIPNPVKESTFIPVTLNRSDDITLTISNVIGKKVLTKTIFLQKGKTNVPVDLHGLQPGVYLYTISNGINTATRRMIISND